MAEHRDRLGGLDGLLLRDAHREQERVEIHAVERHVELHHRGHDRHRGFDALIGVSAYALLGHAQADDLGLVGLGKRKERLEARALGGGGVDDRLKLADLEAGLHRERVHGVEAQTRVRNRLLYHLHDPLHHLGAALGGRAEVDVEDVGAAFDLAQRHLADRAGVALLHRRADGLAHDVDLFTDDEHVVLLGSGCGGAGSGCDGAGSGERTARAPPLVGAG